MKSQESARARALALTDTTSDAMIKAMAQDLLELPATLV